MPNTITISRTENHCHPFLWCLTWDLLHSLKTRILLFSWQLPWWGSAAFGGVDVVMCVLINSRSLEDFFRVGESGENLPQGKSNLVRTEDGYLRLREQWLPSSGCWLVTMAVLLLWPRCL